jgi:hypothetical protein
MTGERAIETSSAWADYVWFSACATSRLVALVAAFFETIELAALSGSRSLAEAADALLASGELSALMTRHGSDKGNGWHNYTVFYEVLFGGWRGRVGRLFELGIGSSDPAIPCNMGPDAVPGASLRAWRDYFPNAAIYGADIDRDMLFTEDRIRTAWVDQHDPTSIAAMFREFDTDFDVIVDDGHHDFVANRTLFESAITHLRSGGVYVIEDISLQRKEPYKALLRELDAALVEIPNRCNGVDNCVAVIAK